MEEEEEVQAWQWAYKFYQQSLVRKWHPHSVLLSENYCGSLFFNLQCLVYRFFPLLPFSSYRIVSACLLSQYFFPKLSNFKLVISLILKESFFILRTVYHFQGLAPRESCRIRTRYGCLAKLIHKTLFSSFSGPFYSLTFQMFPHLPLHPFTTLSGGGRWPPSLSPPPPPYCWFSKPSPLTHTQTQ